jgi:hypothetical protein
MGFEGGSPVEVNFKDQILKLKKRYSLSMNSPITPTINCFVGMLFMKLLLAGIVNSQNNGLLVWGNFGPNGVLSAGDQWSIIIGNICLVIALILLTMMSVNLVYTPSWMFAFGKKAQGVENLLRRQANHKWFLFTLI